MTNAVVCVDVGSTYTKAAAVDADTGDLLGTASHPTTLATDVMEGLRAAAEAAVPKAANVVDTLVCSSAGGGLRLAVIGNEPLVTARAAYRAGLSAGARVVDVRAGRLADADFAALADARPDVILLAGGTDGGDDTAVRDHAAALAASGIRTPVVYAGNADAFAAAAADLDAAGIAVTGVANVLPRIGALNPVPARTALREVFLRHVIAGKHLSASADFTRMVKAATPDAVLTGVELLADRIADDLLVVDVGGATTDVYSVLTPDAEREGPRAEVAGTAWRSRTVEGDLGVRHTAVGIAEAADDEDLPTSAALEEAAGLRTANPAFRADDPGPDAELSALAARIAVRRHARGEQIGGPTEPLRGGKDLAAVGLVIGSGGVLRRDPAAAAWLREAVGADTSGGVRPPKDARFAVDADYRLAPAGLLAANGYRHAAEGLLGAWSTSR
ncbi:glutamate mutase L [Glycomyces sp. TRM65418]|uniref:glutamate mutase L n=1 Tax=Glycomyces sp. TRM65418 TaxID=2867006 RepID=UPI001CE56470|nr:glutamate mutase L [Glycomyces sp. TRM65418]MCC3765256.1 glutamate mutase L [Glycomyces sp. TRM65418]QZD54877.1 glutamate mutase L [Glycomyces sp. TRM65418]